MEVKLTSVAAAGRTANGPSAREGDNNFTLLRLALASLVILAHSIYLVEGERNPSAPLTVLAHYATLLGDMAVNCFFAVSGYLLAQSWVRSPMLAGFLWRRTMRIYPGFIVATLVSGLLIGPFVAASDYFGTFDWSAFLAGTFWLQNPKVPEVFAGQYIPALNVPMWTISYEFRCYLLLGVLGLFGLVRRKVWLGIFGGILAVVVLTPGLAATSSFNEVYPVIGQPGSLLRFICFFLAGGAFWYLRDNIRFNPVLLVLAVILLVASVVVRSEYISFRTLAASTAGVYLLFAFAFWRAPALAPFRRGPDISYGTYLYGWPAQKLFMIWFPQASWPLVFLATFTLAGTCGFISWHGIEKHFLNLKTRAPSSHLVDAGERVFAPAREARGRSES